MCESGKIFLFILVFLFYISLYIYILFYLSDNKDHILKRKKKIEIQPLFILRNVISLIWLKI